MTQEGKITQFILLLFNQIKTQKPFKMEDSWMLLFKENEIEPRRKVFMFVMIEEVSSREFIQL